MSREGLTELEPPGSFGVIDLFPLRSPKAADLLSSLFGGTSGAALYLQRE